MQERLGNIYTSLHLALKYVRILVRGHYLLRDVISFPTLTNWLFLYYQLELEEQIFVFWSSLIHMKTSYPFYRKKRIFN